MACWVSFPAYQEKFLAIQAISEPEHPESVSKPQGKAWLTGWNAARAPVAHADHALTRSV